MEAPEQPRREWTLNQGDVMSEAKAIYCTKGPPINDGPVRVVPATYAEALDISLAAAREDTAEKVRELRDDLESAEARAVRAEGERDEAVQSRDTHKGWNHTAERERDEANRRAERAEQALRDARESIIAVNVAGFDSTRGDVALTAIKRIDAALLAAGKTVEGDS